MVGVRVRLALGSAVLVLIAGLTACSGGNDSASRPRPHQPTSTVITTPSTTSTTTLTYAPVATHPEAFRGFGKIAYVSGGQLYVLDGTGAAPRDLAGVEVRRMAWSPDGLWLAYQEQGPNGGGGLFIVPVAGGSPTQVSASPFDWQWSPTAATLAVVAEAPDTKAFGGPVELVRPERPAAPVAVANPPYLGSYALSWSPDGKTLAFAVYRRGQPAVDHLFAVTVGCGGSCLSRLREVPVGVSPGNTDNGLEFADWTPDSRRALVWIDAAHSGSIRLDGLVLASVSLTGAPDTALPVMLAKSSWVVPVPGRDAVLLDAGGGRDWDQARVLTTCTATTGSCRPLVVGSGPVLDPSVTRDGSRLAYVATDPIPFAVTGTSDPSQFPPESSIRWSRSRRLVVSGIDGTGARTVSTGGVIAPRWAGDGRHLVFGRAGYLWLVDAANGTETAIAGPIDAFTGTGFNDGLPFEENPYLFPGNDVWDQTAWLP
jgi:Tol biopolymer transport system component